MQRHHLGGNVKRGPTYGGAEFSCIHTLSKAKVPDLDLAEVSRRGAADEDVLKLQVPVRNTAHVHVLNAVQQLNKDLSGLLLREAVPVLQHGHEVAPWHQFHHKENLVVLQGRERAAGREKAGRLQHTIRYINLAEKSQTTEGDRGLRIL